MQSAMKTEQYSVEDAESASLIGLSDEALLSAWMDSEECGDYGQSTHDGQQDRQVWDTYHLIGDVMRNPDLAIKTSSAFRTRVSRALDSELPIIAAPKRRLSLRFGLSGLAVAAAVATVVWVAQPFVGDDDVGGRTQVADATASGTNVSLDDASLGDYLEAHRQMAGPSAVRQVSFAGGADR